MAEPNNLVEFGVQTITALWKKVGGAAGIWRAAVKEISAVLAYVALAVVALGLADAFLLITLEKNMGAVNAPFASPLSFVRFAYLLTHVLMIATGFITHHFFLQSFMDSKEGVVLDGVLTFATPFMGVAAQIAVYTCLTASRLVWRLIDGHAPGRYELYVLLLVAGKGAYLFWLNSQYAAFLEFTKKAAEAAVASENTSKEAAVEDDLREEADEENEHSEENSKENDQNEDNIEPGGASESGSTDWEMD